MTSSFDLAQGTLFAGDFTIGQPLAARTFGAIYAVEQRSTGEQLSLAVFGRALVPEDARARFEEEALARGRLASAHVPRVIAAGIDAETGRPFVAMEALKGALLADEAADHGPFEAAEAAEILAPICAALAAAHAMGVVHAGLSPESVFLGPRRRRARDRMVKLLDVGVARLVASTAAGAEIDTMTWAAPEVIEARQISPAADIWSLGLLAFWMLSGQDYWRALDSEQPDLLALRREVLEVTLVPASQRACEQGGHSPFPDGFDEWFGRCVTRDPWARFLTTEEAGAALGRLLGASAPAPRPGPVASVASQWGDVPMDLIRGGPARPAAPQVSLPTRAVVGLIVGTVVLAGLGLGGLSTLFTGARSTPPPLADLAKIAIALTAGAFCLLDAVLSAWRRHLPKLVGKVILVCLGLAAIVAYFNAFQFGYAKYYHRWEHYHQFVGAKYFPELGYDNLYRCAAVAQDELGTVEAPGRDGQVRTIDLRKELREPGRTVRELSGAFPLVPMEDMLKRPELCKSRFSPERWGRFKEDIKFFRVESDKMYWVDMQRDYGYHASPVWAIVGRLFGELSAASVGYQQALSMLDIGYLTLLFAALWWAFGARVSGAAAVFFGCQAPAPFFWTGGAYLRQDWLFYLVLAVCLLRKRYPALAGAALAYACLLRLFPMYMLIGMGIAAGMILLKRHVFSHAHRRLLLGAALAAAVLLPLSIVVTRADAWGAYFEREEAAALAPVTNEMGLAVVLAHDFGGGPGSGRMEFTGDPSLPDQWSVWKSSRVERYRKTAPLRWVILAAALPGFALVIRRRRLPWIGASLGHLFIVLFAHITCFHYSFLVLAAPLTRVRRWLEIALFSFAALTQIISLSTRWNDDKYALLSVVSLLFSLGVLAAFASCARSSPGSQQAPRLQRRDPP